ncbi:hypothetical protein [Hoylesella timonensis]|nr:hypothetical protein [Hoylesella timonensis]
MDERWDDHTIGRALADPELREQAFMFNRSEKKSNSYVDNYS